MRQLALVALLAVLAGAKEMDGPAPDAALLQTSKTEDTPVTRVVKLLQEMQKQVKKEMDEDEEIYDKVKCWCMNNKYEKDNAVEEAEATIKELESTNEELATAEAIRDKQLKEFHGGEVDSIQAIENLKP